MRMIRVVASVLALAPGVSTAQSVPEGIHRLSTGPAAMCGVAGRTTLELVANARQSSELRAVSIPSERFEMFEGGDPVRYQLVVTLPSEEAYPAASCRELYDDGGALRMKRSMSCDAGRTECDALFQEFRALDVQMTRELQGVGR